MEKVKTRVQSVLSRPRAAIAARRTRLEARFSPVIAKVTPSTRVRQRLFRTLLATSLVLVSYLFYSLLETQNRTRSPNLARERLVEAGLVLETGQWTARFSQCERTADGVRACAEVGEETKITFPAKDMAERVYAKADGRVNTVRLTWAPTEGDRAFLDTYDVVSLVLPRSIQNWVRVRVGKWVSETHGAGLDVVFSIFSEEIIEAGKIELEFDYDEFPWFGPADLPAALVERDSAGTYASLPNGQILTANLSRQMEVGFPVLLAAMAIVLDHSRVFAWLSLYAGSRAARSFLAFLVENGGEKTPLIEAVAYANNGLAFAFFLLFVVEICGFKSVRARHRAAIIAASVGGFLLGGRFVSDFWLSADAWSDFLGAMLAMPLCLWGVWRSWAPARRGGENAGGEGGKKAKAGADDQEATLVSRAVVYTRLAMIFFAAVTYAWANGTDLFQVSNEAFKNTLDWKHTALLPCILTAALLDVGSTAKKMLTFGKEMAAKALFERELSVGKEVQHRMLPVRRKDAERWAWRSFYFPAQALAGDWYDVRELSFSCGRSLLACVVADVTGHGVGSSLATSVICSHWSLWCGDACRSPAPIDKAAREALLASAPARINDGLNALPQNEQCTAIFALLDPEAGEISFCSGGHPGIIVSDGKGLRYLTSTGERLGAAGVEAPVWIAKTEALAPTEVACLYSDGIVPPGDTVSSFAAGLRRRLKKQPSPLLPLLWNQVRVNSRVFRVDHEIEDDMTLLAIALKETAAAGAPGSAETAAEAGPAPVAEAS